MTSRRRRVYLTIIAVGLVLVAIDRLFIQNDSAKLGPQTAAASAPDAGREAPADDQKRFAQIWIPPISLEVPKAWRELAEQADAMLRHPFAAGTRMRAAALLENADGADAGEPSTEAFGDRHRLEAILSSQLRPRAIIDGEVVSLGDRIDGYVIDGIDAWSVRLRGPDGIVTLTLPTDELDVADPKPR